MQFQKSEKKSALKSHVDCGLSRATNECWSPNRVLCQLDEPTFIEPMDMNAYIRMHYIIYVAIKCCWIKSTSYRRVTSVFRGDYSQCRSVHLCCDRSVTLQRPRRRFVPVNCSFISSETMISAERELAPSRAENVEWIEGSGRTLERKTDARHI